MIVMASKLVSGSKGAVPLLQFCVERVNDGQDRLAEEAKPELALCSLSRFSILDQQKYGENEEKDGKLKEEGALQVINTTVVWPVWPALRFFKENCTAVFHT